MSTISKVDIHENGHDRLLDVQCVLSSTPEMKIYTIVLQEIVVRYSEGKCNFLGNRQEIGKSLIGQFMELDCMFLRDHQTMPAGKRLNVQEGVTSRLSNGHLSTYLLAVSMILKE